MRSNLKHPNTCRGLTLLEILVVIAVVALLAALLYPLVVGVRERAANITCSSNLRQISAASVLYSSDNNGDWPPNAVGTVYSQYLIPYLGFFMAHRTHHDFMSSPLVCPSAKTNAPDSTWSYQGIYTPVPYTFEGTDTTVRYGLSYGQNVYAPGSSASTGNPNRMSVREPSQMMLYMDNQGHYLVSIGGINNVERAKLLKQRHKGRVNVAYVDGRIESIDYDDIPTRSPPLSYFWNGRISN